MGEVIDGFERELIRVMYWEDDRMLLPDALVEARGYFPTAGEDEVAGTVVTTLKRLIGEGIAYLAYTEWGAGLPERRRLTEEEASHELDADWWKPIPPSPSTPVLIRLTERGEALAMKLAPPFRA